jgi:hypothetical protein
MEHDALYAVLESSLSGIELKEKTILLLKTIPAYSNFNFFNSKMRIQIY